MLYNTRISTYDIEKTPEVMQIQFQNSKRKKYDFGRNFNEICRCRIKLRKKTMTKTFR